MPARRTGGCTSFLTEGIREVVYTDEYGAEQNPTIWLLDRGAGDVDNNDFMAARQVQDRGGRASAPVRCGPVREWDAARLYRAEEDDRWRAR